jgi:hypothetical protein
MAHLGRPEKRVWWRLWLLHQAHRFRPFHTYSCRAAQVKAARAGLRLADFFLIFLLDFSRFVISIVTV